MQAHFPMGLVVFVWRTVSLSQHVTTYCDCFHLKLDNVHVCRENFASLVVKGLLSFVVVPVETAFKSLVAL